VLVLFMLLLVPILGISTLAIDVGYWWHEKTSAQAAADAAALAAASSCRRPQTSRSRSRTGTTLTTSHRAASS
jgi:Flp pilus assembly protein TadG